MSVEYRFFGLGLTQLSGCGVKEEFKKVCLSLLDICLYTVIDSFQPVNLSSAQMRCFVSGNEETDHGM